MTRFNFDFVWWCELTIAIDNFNITRCQLSHHLILENAKYTFKSEQNEKQIIAQGTSRSNKILSTILFIFNQRIGEKSPESLRVAVNPSAMRLHRLVLVLRELLVDDKLTHSATHATQACQRLSFQLTYIQYICLPFPTWFSKLVHHPTSQHHQIDPFPKKIQQNSKKFKTKVQKKKTHSLKWTKKKMKGKFINRNK